jgi:hypothetical protein
MTVDPRENILNQMVVIAQAVTGIETTARNRGLMSNDKRPLIILLDGDETPKLSLDTRRLRGRSLSMGPQIVTMKPEVYIIPKEPRPIGEEGGVNIGTTINDIRTRYIKEIWADATLTTLIGTNGSIVYNGMSTDLKSGSTLSGQMRLDFVINYVLATTGN